MANAGIKVKDVRLRNRVKARKSAFRIKVM